MNQFYSAYSSYWPFGFPQLIQQSEQNSLFQTQSSYFHLNPIDSGQRLWQRNILRDEQCFIFHSFINGLQQAESSFQYQQQQRLLQQEDPLQHLASQKLNIFLKSNENDDSTKKIESNQDNQVLSEKDFDTQIQTHLKVEQKFAGYKKLDNFQKSSLQIITIADHIDFEINSQTPQLVHKEQSFIKKTITKQKSKCMAQQTIEKNQQSKYIQNKCFADDFYSTRIKLEENFNRRIHKFIQNQKTQKSLEIEQKKNSSNLIPITREKSKPNDKYFNKKKTTFHQIQSIQDEIRKNLDKIECVESAIEDLQNQKKEEDRLSTLSKCIFITQSSQIKIVVDNIINSPCTMVTQPKQEQSTECIDHDDIQKIKNDSLNHQHNQEGLHTIKKMRSQEDQESNLRKNFLNQISFSPQDTKQLIIKHNFIANKIHSHSEESQKMQNVTSPIQSIQLRMNQQLQFNEPIQLKQENRNQNSIIDRKYQKINVSKFHNLNKLFICSIIKMLQQENLDNFKIHQPFKTEILNFLHLFKQSGKLRLNFNDDKSTGQINNVESFSHVHYKTLFLRLNDSNLQILQKSARDIQIHNYCYKIDLLNCLEIEICRVNLLKRIMFQIFMLSVNEPKYDVDLCKNSKLKCRVIYAKKAIDGIKKLSSGIFLNRF